MVVPFALLFKHFGIEEMRNEMNLIMNERNLGLFSIVNNYPDENKNYHRELLLYSNPKIC